MERLWAEALGWLGTPAAVEALGLALDRHLRDGSTDAFRIAERMPDALRRAGGAGVMARLRAKYATTDSKALAAFDDYVGGDPTDVPLLTQAQTGPSPESIGALTARMARFSYWASWPPRDVILASFQLGLDLLESGPEETREPATQLLQSMLRVDTAGTVQAEIADIARMVSEDLAAGRLLRRTRPGLPFGPFDDVVNTKDARDYGWVSNRVYAYTADPGYGRFLECDLRRDQDVMAVTIRNVGDRTVLVNRVGLKYGETQGGAGR